MRSHEEFSYSIRARSCPRLQQICHWLHLKNIQLGSLFKLSIFKERLKVYHQSCLLIIMSRLPQDTEGEKTFRNAFLNRFLKKPAFPSVPQATVKRNVLLCLGAAMPVVGVSCTFQRWRRSQFLIKRVLSAYSRGNHTKLCKLCKQTQYKNKNELSNLGTVSKQFCLVE